MVKQMNDKWKYILLLVPALAVFYNNLYNEQPGTHIDEVYWIGSTYYYHLLVEEMHWSHSDWQLLPAQENPPVGKYFMGGGWIDLFGDTITTPDLLGSFYLVFPSESGAWGSGADYEKRKAVADRVEPGFAGDVRQYQRIPLRPEDLQASRSFVLLCGMLCATLICLIGFQCQTQLGGLLAGLGFAVHPNAANAYNFASIDIIALTFSCLAVSIYIKIAFADPDDDRRGTWTSCWLALALCLTLALACSTKMNALIVVALGLLLWLFALGGWVRFQSSFSKNTFVIFAIGFAVAVPLFVLLNPSLYRDIFDGLSALFYEHALTLDIQAAFTRRLDTVPERFGALGRMVTYLPTLLLFVIGLALWQGWRAGIAVNPHAPRRKFIVIVYWWFLSCILVLLWLPFEWARYSLPLIPRPCSFWQRPSTNYYVIAGIGSAINHIKEAAMIKQLLLEIDALIAPILSAPTNGDKRRVFLLVFFK